MRRPGLLLALLAAGCALAGCSLSGPIARQAIDYNSAVETAANTLMVRNILRARDNAPLHFTTVPQIRGSLSLGITQPGLFGPAGNGAQNGAGIGLQALTSPSFDVAALDTQEFTRGLLEPVEPQLFRYFAERGVSEQLLALLLLETVVDEASGERVTNDPRCWFARPDCPDHVDPATVRRAFITATGEGRYYFHQFTALTPLGPPLATATVSAPTMLAALDPRKLRLLPIANGRFQLYQVDMREAACRHATAGARRPASGGCTAQEMVEPARLAGTGVQDPPGVQVQLRSVAEIFRFLGRLLQVQDELRGSPGDPQACLAFPVRAADPPQEACLFRITRDSTVVLPAGVAFAADYAGETYRVPSHAEPRPGIRGDYTLRVMALLTDLLNLKKNSNAIPATRAVQLVR